MDEDEFETWEDDEDTDELGDDGVELWLPGEGQV